MAGRASLWPGALQYPGLREHAIQAQIDSLQTILEHESAEAIQHLYDKQKQFAFKLQSEAPFKAALEKRDAAQMHAWLGESYSRYQVASGEFKLKAIIVRDLSGKIFAHSSDDGLNSYGGCPTALKSLGGSLIRLLKPRYALCSFDADLYSEVLVPVGALEPKAYLHIVAYAVEGLKHIEQQIRIPISVDNGLGTSLYHSPDWVAVKTGTHLYPATNSTATMPSWVPRSAPPMISSRCSTGLIKPRPISLLLRPFRR